MTTQEKDALDVLLFGTDGEELLDIKCFRGDRADVTEDDIKAQIHAGVMQHKMQPSIATRKAPKSGVERRDVVEFANSLPLAA
jgi:hypothetical protein